MIKPLLKITFKEPFHVWYDGECSLANFIVLDKIFNIRDFIVYNYTGNRFGSIIYLDLIKSIEFINPNEL